MKAVAEAGLAPPSSSAPPSTIAPASAIRRAVVSRVLIVSPPWAGMGPATRDCAAALDIGQAAYPCRPAESPEMTPPSPGLPGRSGSQRRNQHAASGVVRPLALIG